MAWTDTAERRHASPGVLMTTLDHRGHQPLAMHQVDDRRLSRRHVRRVRSTSTAGPYLPPLLDGRVGFAARQPAIEEGCKSGGQRWPMVVCGPLGARHLARRTSLPAGFGITKQRQGLAPRWGCAAWRPAAPFGYATRNCSQLSCRDSVVPECCDVAEESHQEGEQWISSRTVVRWLRRDHLDPRYLLQGCPG
jgi:hypothetical protein